MSTHHISGRVLSISAWIIIVTVGLICAANSNVADAQVPAATGGTAPPAEASYYELRRSQNRQTRQLAERYHNLVKLQEWSSDKGTTIKAKYVSHKPDLKSVTLAVVKGYGAQRVETQRAVPVERLSKTCQSRVRQIAAVQKKLDEIVKAAPTDVAPAQAPGAEHAGVEQGVGAERGVAPPEQPTQIETTRPTPDLPDGIAPRGAQSSPIEDDGNADPLGFAELPQNSNPTTSTASFIVPPSSVANPASLQDAAAPDRQSPQHDVKWRTDYDAFRANFRVDPSNPLSPVDFGSLKALKEAVDEVQRREATGSVSKEEQRDFAKKFAAVGEFVWEATLADGDSATTDWTERLNLPPLPEPLTITFHVAESELPKWQQLKAGDRVRFAGRFVDVEAGSDLIAEIRLFTGAGLPPDARRARNVPGGVPSR
jgi:hypothetical protein